MNIEQRILYHKARLALEFPLASNAQIERLARTAAAKENRPQQVKGDPRPPKPDPQRLLTLG